ncbi:SRPBCC family protein [Tomitella biformata]|uniref:SRPBCC family protein n=1 Tax=Tomitella biformata TaxID=630403 RepID=UPI000467CE60|nr:SRPBCC family protein [Tomitella biformata]
MAHRFVLDPVDLTFFHTAPHVSRQICELKAGPDEVWAALTATRPLSWCRMLTSVRFEGEPPYGAGALRHVEVGGAMRMEERFFHWDEAGRRYAFHAATANVPLFQAFAEDYLVEEISGGSRFTWTFASAPRRGFGLALKLGAPVNNLLFASLGADTTTRFGALDG